MEVSIVISNSPNPNNVIQQVSKASSDQLLRKFAEIESDSETASSAPRKSASSKRPRRKPTKMSRKGVINQINSIEDNYNNNNSGSCNNKVVERKSLLPQHYRDKSRRTSSSSGGSLFKHHRSGGRDFRTKVVLSAIEKTWTKAIRGATKVFMEKHYNRHRMLIIDMV